MKGNIKECVDFVASKFEFKFDKKFFIDQWFVMKDKDGKFRGDCDDFTITVLWYYYGCSLLSFIWNVLVKHDCKIIRVKTSTGEFHIIGSVDGLFFDNWSLKALPEEDFFNRTKHNKLSRYNVFTMLGKLLVGLITR